MAFDTRFFPRYTALLATALCWNAPLCHAQSATATPGVDSFDIQSAQFSNGQSVVFSDLDLSTVTNLSNPMDCIAPEYAQRYHIDPAAYERSANCFTLSARRDDLVGALAQAKNDLDQLLTARTTNSESLAAIRSELDRRIEQNTTDANWAVGINLALSAVPASKIKLATGTAQRVIARCVTRVGGTKSVLFLRKIDKAKGSIKRTLKNYCSRIPGSGAGTEVLSDTLSKAKAERITSAGVPTSYGESVLGAQLEWVAGARSCLSLKSVTPVLNFTTKVVRGVARNYVLPISVGIAADMTIKDPINNSDSRAARFALRLWSQDVEILDSATDAMQTLLDYVIKRIDTINSEIKALRTHIQTLEATIPSATRDAEKACESENPIG